jgi:hypothetical protein
MEHSGRMARLAPPEAATSAASRRSVALERALAAGDAGALERFRRSAATNAIVLVLMRPVGTVRSSCTARPGRQPEARLEQRLLRPGDAPVGARVCT